MRHQSQLEVEREPLQIILTPQQFELVKMVYPRAFVKKRSGAGANDYSSKVGHGKSNNEGTFQDPRLIIQFFANLKSLYVKQ